MLATPTVEIVCDNCLDTESTQLTEMARGLWSKEYALAKFAEWDWVIDEIYDFCCLACQLEYEQGDK